MESNDLGNGGGAAKADTDTDTDTGADSNDDDGSDASSDRSLKARLRCWHWSLLILLSTTLLQPGRGANNGITEFFELALRHGFCLLTRCLKGRWGWALMEESSVVVALTLVHGKDVEK